MSIDLYLGHKRPRYFADGIYHGGKALPTSRHDEQLSSPGRKRARSLADRNCHAGKAFSSSMHDETASRKTITGSKGVDFSDPLATRDFLGALDSRKFGSVTNEIKALSQKMLTLYPYFEKYLALVSQFLEMGKSKSTEAPESDNQQRTNSSFNNVIDLDHDCASNEKTKTSLPIVNIDSDEEDIDRFTGLVYRRRKRAGCA